MASLMRAAAGAALVLLVASPVLGQGQSTEQGAGGETPVVDRCAAWGGTQPQAAPGSPSECRLPTDPVDLLASDDWQVPPGVVDLIGSPELFRVEDRLEDHLRLDGAPVDGTPDPATDINQVRHGRFTLDRRAARDMIRLVKSPEFRDKVVLGGPPQQLFKAGEFDVFALDLAGDPTSDPAGNRVYQLVFMGADPTKTVVSTIPETNPLAGGRHVITIFQQPGDGPDRALASDFGSKKLGPDGQTQYYNAPARVAVFPSPNGFVVITPAGLNPQGYRAEALDAATGAWDFVGAPDGPMAFVPTDGSAPSTLQLPLLELAHDPIADQDLLVDGQAVTGQTLPSQQRLSGTTIERVIGLVASAEWDLDDRRLLYEKLQAALHDEAPIVGMSWGIPAYGRYCIPRDGGTAFLGGDGSPLSWADGSSVAFDANELRRSLGTSCWRVDQAEGVLHQAAVEELLVDVANGAPGFPSYDPEAARLLLEEAGWRRTEDGFERP